MGNCQHCGEELTNPRAKNCKVCKDILEAAYGAGTYSVVTQAIATAKATGITGEAMHQVMREAAEAGVALRHQRRDEQRERDEQRKRERQAEQRKREEYYRQYGHWPSSEPEEYTPGDIEEQAKFAEAQRDAKRGVHDMTEDY
jgi:acetyl-CoA carboxylase carboxyltransferase component